MALCSIVIVLFAESALAQQPTPPASALPPGVATTASRAMTLPAALAYAQAHQPALALARSRIAVAQADAAIPGAQWQPEVGATAQLLGGTANNSTASYVSQSVARVPRIGGTKPTATPDWKPYPSTFVGLGVNQEIFDFGRIAAQSAAADALVNVARYRADEDTYAAGYAIMEAFFAVRAAHAVVVAADGAFDRARVHRDFAKAAVDSGLRPPLDLTRAEADLSRFDVGRIRARGGLAAAQAVFAASVGVPEPLLDAAEAAPAPPSNADVERAVQALPTRDPVLLEAEARIDAQRKLTTAIGAERRPNVSLSALGSARAGGADPSSGDAAPGGGWAPSVPNYSVGLVVTWPIYDGTVGARADASRAREHALRWELETLRERDVSVVRSAYVAMRVAEAAEPALVRALEAAQANYAQVDARFRSGLATSVELADAEAVRTEAEIQLALGRFELERARATYRHAAAEDPWKSR